MTFEEYGFLRAPVQTSSFYMERYIQDLGYPFYHGVQPFSTSEAGPWGLLSETGEVLLRPQWHALDIEEETGLLYAAKKEPDEY